MRKLIKQTAKPRQPEVIIAGGGWAGIAAAVKLASAGIAVRILESEKQLGRRTRCSKFGKLKVDNGQKIIFGYYHYILDLARLIKQPRQKLFSKKPFRLAITSTSRKGLYFRSKPLFAPWHMGLGIITASGISWSEKQKIASFWRAIKYADKTQLEKLSVLDLLKESQQTESLIKRFWEPSCLTLLNAPVESASALLFAKLINTLIKSRECSHLLFPKSDLNSLLAVPAIEFIENNGGIISLNQTITRLHLNGNSTPSVSTKKEKLECKELILALPYKTCAALFQEHSALHQIYQKLNNLQSSPVTTVYLKYAEKVSIPQRFIGVYDGYFNWFFDRRYCNQKNLIAGTSFISPEIFATDGTTPAEKCQQELSRIFPKWPKPVDSITISEPDAKLCCSVSSNVYRPGYHTGLPNCYLAGDYTDTGLPGTIESAVKSGIKCAEQIIQSRKK